MKVNICDICYKNDKKLVEATSKISIKKMAYLNIDICDKCSKSGIVPKPIKDYVKFVYKLDGLDLTDERVNLILKR